jgi:hypothetical protein
MSGWTLMMETVEIPETLVFSSTLTRLIAQEYSYIENILCPKPRLTAEFNNRIYIPYDGAFGLWSIQYKILIR